MTEEAQKIGLFFGSFNPVHVGHLALANFIVENSDLSEIWFIVSPQNPFKQTIDLADSSHRLNMLKASTQNCPFFKVIDIELKLPTPSYTYKTLRSLAKQHTNTSFTLIMGSDNLVNLHRWKNIDEILTYCNVMVYPRPGFSTTNSQLDINITIIDAPVFNIESTTIREGLHCGKNYQFLIPEKAYQYLIEKGLYGTGKHKQY